MQDYTLEDLIFVCKVLQSSIRYSTYERGALQKIILILEKLEDMFASMKDPEDKNLRICQQTGETFKPLLKGEYISTYIITHII